MLKKIFLLQDYRIGVNCADVSVDEQWIVNNYLLLPFDNECPQPRPPPLPQQSRAVLLSVQRDVTSQHQPGSHRSRGEIFIVTQGAFHNILPPNTSQVTVARLGQTVDCWDITLCKYDWKWRYKEWFRYSVFIFFMKPSLSKYLHVPLFHHLLCTKAVVPWDKLNL